MISRLEEMRLIALCITTDSHRAFEQLVVAYQADLRRFLYNLTLGNASLTDDLMQDTFLKAYLSIASFKGLSRFKTWLFRIAINEFNNYIRRHHEDALDDIGHLERNNAYTPSQSTDSAIDVQYLLSLLSASERMVIELFYLEDMPIKKISKITSLPEGTVKSHLSRAKAKMASHLNKDKL